MRKQRLINRLRRRGATTTEYMAIMALIILPIAALYGRIFMPMIKTYGGRLTSLVGLPFP